MRRRYYSSRFDANTNTCSIRSLKKAFIGNSVRMSSDKNTVSFENVPMKGMLIENYNEQGFRISHPSLPKAVWVDFDQLPLTRLQISNGVISDEITFVENIVKHKMQLIRTLDTEYMDMLYKEKGLDEKKEEIIPISEAIPGQIYIGAQCEEGAEMIYIGTFFTKQMREDYRGREKIHYFQKLSPSRAFFAVLGDDLSYLEKEKFINQFFGSSNNRWKMEWEVRKEIDKQMEKAKKEYLENQKIPRFKIVQFAITSKRIKEVILTHKENDLFKNKEENIQNLLYYLSDQIPESPKYTICNSYKIDDVFFVSENKNNIEEDAKNFASEKFKITIQPKAWEERYK